MHRRQETAYTGGGRGDGRGDGGTDTDTDTGMARGLPQRLRALASILLMMLGIWASYMMVGVDAEPKCNLDAGCAGWAESLEKGEPVKCDDAAFLQLFRENGCRIGGHITDEAAEVKHINLKTLDSSAVFMGAVEGRPVEAGPRLEGQN